MKNLISFNSSMSARSQIDYFRVALQHFIDTKKNVTEAWVADKIGMSQSYISMILSGQRNGTVKTRSAIAAAFKMDYVEFWQLGKRLSIKQEEGEDSSDMDNSELTRVKLELERYKGIVEGLKIAGVNVDLSPFPNGTSLKEK